MIADQQEAELLMSMSGTPEPFSEKVSKPVIEVEAMCKMLYHKGLASKSYKGDTIGYKNILDNYHFRNY